jgi:exonuclease SbcD
MHRVDSEPCPVYYSGSPLSYSFAEANQEKFVVLAELEPGQKANVKEIGLTSGKKLLRKKAIGMEEAIAWLMENTDSLVELTLVTDTFLTARERRQLNAVHGGIVAVIPEVQNELLIKGSSQKSIDLSKSMNELFADYFRHKKGQDPNEDIMKLFTELLAEEDKQ